jgi:hypothetical protein
VKIIISGTVDLDPDQMDAAMAAAKPLIIGALTQEPTRLRNILKIIGTQTCEKP